MPRVLAVVIKPWFFLTPVTSKPASRGRIKTGKAGLEAVTPLEETDNPDKT